MERRPFLSRPALATRTAMLALPCLATNTSVAATVFVHAASPETLHDGASWATAFLKIPDAVSAAAANDEIWVATGTYTDPATLKNGMALYGGFAGTEAERGQRSPATNVTVLQSDGSASLITIPAGAGGTIVDGFTVKGNTYYGDSAIACAGAHALIAHNLFTGNVAYNGAAISGSADFLTVSDNTFANNSATASFVTRLAVSGGAIQCSGSHLTVTRNTFTGNSAYLSLYANDANASAKGGAIASSGDFTMILNNNFQKNKAEAEAQVTGGGPYGAYAAAAGGAVFSTGASPAIVNNTFLENSASYAYSNRYSGGAGGEGGAVSVGGSGAAIRSNLFRSNSVQAGGAVGAGLSVSGDSAAIANNTFVSNGAQGAALALSGGSANAANNVVAFNTTGIAFTGAGAVPAFSHNDVFSNSGSDYQGVADPTFTNGNIKADPRFQDQAGGDDRLRPDSPCIETGDDAAVAAGGTDLDGQPRKQGAHVDMGAYEAAPPPYTFQDAIAALRAGGGLSAATASGAPRWDVEKTGGATLVDILDAARIARKAAGLDSNP